MLCNVFLKEKGLIVFYVLLLNEEGLIMLYEGAGIIENKLNKLL